MSHTTTPLTLLLLPGALSLALLASPAQAHVVLDAPNGGEQLPVGTTFTVTWHVQINHGQLNWDLWYSTVGPNGPWTTLAMDLPPGSPVVGSVHTYDWTIPDMVEPNVWIRVRQDNANIDYYDVSDGPFSIIPAPPCPGDFNGDLVVDVIDMLAMLAVWGPCAACDEDLVPDGVIDVLDLLELLAHWGSC